MLAEIRLGSRGVFTEAFPCGNGKFLGLTICWKSKETIRNLYGFSCRTYHSLMVSQHCLDGSYSRHTIMVVCWLRFIFYFRNEFFSTLCTSNNIKCSFNAYQASLTIIRRNLLRFCVCMCVCAGGLMVVSFLKALRIDFKNIPLF